MCRTVSWVHEVKGLNLGMHGEHFWNLRYWGSHDENRSRFCTIFMWIPSPKGRSWRWQRWDSSERENMWATYPLLISTVPIDKGIKLINRSWLMDDREWSMLHHNSNLCNILEPQFQDLLTFWDLFGIFTDLWGIATLFWYDVSLGLWRTTSRSVQWILRATRTSGRYPWCTPTPTFPQKRARFIKIMKCNSMFFLFLWSVLGLLGIHLEALALKFRTDLPSSHWNHLHIHNFWVLCRYSW